jgi:acetylornithine deacetylase
VALLTDLMISLAERRPALPNSVVVVFIANEENGDFRGIGVDQLVAEGHLDPLKRGPLFWIDSADSQPCIGTAGSMQWELRARGKVFHSGLPHRGINSIELAMDAVNFVERRFQAAFPRHALEDKYNFHTQSTLKPTQVSCSPGAINQLPGECTMRGDVRLAPFYEVADVRKAVEGYVQEINDDPSVLHSVESFTRPHSKYVLYDEGGRGEITAKGAIDLRWLFEGENGVACKLDSRGHFALLAATESVLGAVKPYSIGGSLPLIRNLQDQGFDVQISGYGLSTSYHADNEYADLKHMKNATKIISKVFYN